MTLLWRFSHFCDAFVMQIKLHSSLLDFYYNFLLWKDENYSKSWIERIEAEWRKEIVLNETICEWIKARFEGPFDVEDVLMNILKFSYGKIKKNVLKYYENCHIINKNLEYEK